MLKSATPVAILLASWLLKTEEPDFTLLVNITVIALGVAIASVCFLRLSHYHFVYYILY